MRLGAGTTSATWRAPAAGLHKGEEAMMTRNAHRDMGSLVHLSRVPEDRHTACGLPLSDHAFYRDVPSNELLRAEVCAACLRARETARRGRPARGSRRG